MDNLDLIKFSKVLGNSKLLNEKHLKVALKTSYNKDGTVAIKLNGLKVSKELANELGLNPKEYVKPKNKPKKVTDKNVPDIPVTPRDKGAPVKSTLTLTKLKAEVDTGFARLDKKIDLGLAKLDTKMTSEFESLKSIVKQLTGMVKEQSKSLKEQNKSGGEDPEKDRSR